MSLYESVLRPMMFQLDPEAAHETAMRFLRAGVLKARHFEYPTLEQTLFGVHFANPLGLAAGFDKNALVLDHWHQLGFGFVECGTVTYHPQPGNDKPRMFRLPQHKAIINRLGFNNEGARAAATRLAEAKPKVPVGVNLGKSKITEVADAAKDYQESFRLLHKFGDYFVVNVSSPNTPGLRSLQEKGPLLEILQALREVDDQRPLFVKVAPDLELSALDDVVDVAKQTKLTGIIATNTTISRVDLPPDARNVSEAGGLSGAPLRTLSNQALRHLYHASGKDMILMGVGGIFNGDDLFEKIALGAHLCQTYTGWVYGGPHMVPDSLKGLVARMAREGIKTLDELRGSAA
jgi:dihydroorotate dehydrogenase